LALNTAPLSLGISLDLGVIGWWRALALLRATGVLQFRLPELALLTLVNALFFARGRMRKPEWGEQNVLADPAGIGRKR
jgi:hypothetical protein